MDKMNKKRQGSICHDEQVAYRPLITYGDIRNLHLRYYIFYELLRFLMISKGSWVALETCSAEILLYQFIFIEWLKAIRKVFQSIGMIAEYLLERKVCLRI